MGDMYMLASYCFCNKGKLELDLFSWRCMLAALFNKLRLNSYLNGGFKVDLIIRQYSIFNVIFHFFCNPLVSNPLGT